MASILLGITGRANSGKDTVAHYLEAEYGFVPMAFADPLKEAAAAMFGVPIAWFHDRNRKEQVIEQWEMSPRHMAQRLGTEAVRHTFGPDFWIKRWLAEYREMRASDHVVVTDVRFNNEAQAIRDLGGTVLHISRPGEITLDAAASAHASEAGVTFFSGTDKEIYNGGTIEDLYTKINDLFSFRGEA